MDNIQLIGHGLKCDNPSCDWTDNTITPEDAKGYIDAPCPKCGENILTQEDYSNMIALLEMVGAINKMTLPLEDDSSKHMKIGVHVHKGIHITDIKPLNEL